MSDRPGLRGRARSAARTVLVASATRGTAIARRHNWIEEPPARPKRRSRASKKSAAPPAVDFNVMLHGLRSVELRRMPKPSVAMLSAGCSDRSYFDWITSCVGPIDRHIGIELYLPEPPELPEGVEWIKNSVGDMSSVLSDSVDVVFSGQNFEHLFEDDAVRFLIESHRVLQVGGHLVIDSPNRDVVARTHWIHPEHTIEFTPEEARTLVELAGFDVTSLRGVWLCADPVTGEDIDLWPWKGEPDPVEMASRAVLAAADPAHSFVWWLEAVKTDREPRVQDLLDEHARIVASATVERRQRLRSRAGTRTSDDDGPLVEVAVGESGAVMFGPYVPLTPGEHTARYVVRRHEGGAPGPACTIDVCDFGGAVIAERPLFEADLPVGEWTTIDLPFSIEEMTWGGQFRVTCDGSSRFDVRFRGDLDPT